MTHLPTADPWQPTRSGQPWTEEDYLTLIRLCRTDAPIEAIADQLQRSDQAILLRAKRMLPITERGLPLDRVPAQLKAKFEADLDYDWRTHLAASPPPRPVIQQILPQPTYAGIEGLRDAELIVFAAMFSQLGRPSVGRTEVVSQYDAVAEELAYQVRCRRVSGEVAALAQSLAMQRVEDAFTVWREYDGWAEWRD